VARPSIESDHKMKNAIRRWLRAKWAQLTHYDLKGDLQMELRAARQDLKDAWMALGKL
jgi:hypothetical protein